MKKYAVMFLICYPLVVFGAPSVRALGGKAVTGASGAAVTKVTPAKINTSGNTGAANAARVGSLRARATTVGAPAAISGSTARFPAILPTKVYNTATTPRPTGSSSTIINTEVDLTEIEQKIEENKQKIEQNETNIETNAGNITTNAENIQTNTTSINSHNTRIGTLEFNADSVRVAGATSPFADRTKPDDRAWIWVESAE